MLMSHPVTITGGGPDLAADLYLPAHGEGPIAGVVTGSGFAGVKEMLLPHFAAALAQAGIATLAVDYAGFGGSAGEPRQDLDPQAQVRDLRRGIDHLCSHPRIDARRVGIFGPSMCGGHTLVVAGTDLRVRAAVSMVPFVRASQAPPSLRLGLAIFADVLRRALSLPSKLIRVAGRPGEAAVMTTDGALAWISEMSANAPSFRNEVTVRSLVRLGNYRPLRSIGPAGIRVPLRTILSTSDSITPAASARAELRAIDHDIHEFSGSHFELFGEHLEQVTRLTVDWFVEHLRGELASSRDSAGASA
jgi:dienelactone hydrolase